MSGRIPIALAGIAVAFGLVSCTASDEAQPSTPSGDVAASPAPAGDDAAPTALREPQGGGPPIPLDTPLRVTAGDYVPPALSDEAQVTGKALLDTAVGQSGRTVTLNGFTVGTGEVGPLPCPPETATRGPADQHPIKIDYLPPNTFETYELYWWVCENGSTAVAGRFFQVSPVTTDGAEPSQWNSASLTIRFINTERAYPFYIYPFQSVEAGTVNGRLAVFIKPVTPQGYGLSEILITTADPEVGYLEIGASHLPFEELLKVAEGVSCPGC